MTQVINSDVAILGQMRLFAGVDERELEALAVHLRHRSYRKGEVIFHQDDPPGGIYFVKKGVVKIQLASADGKRITIAWVRPGNFFGTIGSVKDGPRPESAVALEACDALLLQREHFQAFLKEHPDSAMIMIEQLAQRWQGTLILLQDVAFLDVPGRLAKVLLGLRERGNFSSDGDSTEAPSQAEMATLIGATRESVNKWLQNFCHQGLIAWEGKRIRILDREGLRARLD
jgi:CRP/FNR family transcriptional regulator/CRP/FNR family cyclic AMP-dependent transcriptional regulator